MINPRLKRVCDAVDEWCLDHGIPYDIACDESDLQGMMIFKKDRGKLFDLVNHLQPIAGEDVYMKLTKVRGGNILSFSLRAISEQELIKILAGAGEEEVPMTFKERVEEAAASMPPVVSETEEAMEDKLYRHARKLVEAQRKSATAGMQRSNQSSRQGRESLVRDTSYGGVEHPASPRSTSKRAVDLSAETPQQAQTTKGSSVGTNRGVAKGPNVRFEDKVSMALGLKPQRTTRGFDTQLQEALGGMATATGQQPGDLFAQFARALQVLGQQMGIGPLQEKLKQQGINWKKSDDGLAIILYVTNAQTNAPQPIARITAETLENPGDFEDQLKNMLDFAKGEAPGTLNQKQQELKDQERAIRDIAQAISPQDQESAVSKAMNTGQSAVTPAQPSAQPTSQPVQASQLAATTAASPKRPVLAAGKMRKRSGLI